MNDDSVKLVTKNGECFDASFQGKQVPHDRDGVLYLFYLTDCKRDRGKRLVSLFRSGPAKLGIKDYDSRVEVVRLNALRRAFDSDVLSFDAPVDDEHRFKEVRLDTSDFNPQPPTLQDQIKQYIKHKAYWLGFRYNEKPGVYSLQFDNDIDLEYLGVNRNDVQRYVWLLAEQGFLKDMRFPGSGRPTSKLVEGYESSSHTEAGKMERKEPKEWDVFISHATEDKAAVARPLADALIARGLRVWYDDLSLKVGDSLRQSVDRGLAHSRFGVVILSVHFFEKRWPQQELNGLTQREANGGKVILPVWHEVGASEVRKYSVTLADRIAVQTKDGIDRVVERIMEVVKETTDEHSSPRPVTQTRNSASSIPPATMTRNPDVTITVDATLKGKKTYQAVKLHLGLRELWGSGPTPDDRAVIEERLSPMSALVVEDGDYELTYSYDGKDVNVNRRVVGGQLFS